MNDHNSNFMAVDFYHLCYDATMVLALALNKTIRGMH